MNPNLLSISDRKHHLRPTGAMFESHIPDVAEIMIGIQYNNATANLRIAEKNFLSNPLLPNEVLVKVHRAGICNTDIEILHGYVSDYDGVLGHEFVGAVTKVGSSVHADWIGKRVCADINVPCKKCNICNDVNLSTVQQTQRRNHCPHRLCVGIRRMDGCFATHIRLPVDNLHLVPDHVSDIVAAFAEPLAAALRPFEQGLLASSASVAVVGDGKLGWLITEVLVLRLRVMGEAEKTIRDRVHLFGRHPERSFIGPIIDIRAGAQTDSHFSRGDEQTKTKCYSTDIGCLFYHSQENNVEDSFMRKYDVVIEASGAASGVGLAVKLVKTQGRVILKTTTAVMRPENFQFLETIVVNEISVSGSRCGPIEDALNILAASRIPPYLIDGTPSAADPLSALKTLNLEKYVTKVFPLWQGLDALKEAAKKGALKVQIQCT